MRNAGLPMGQCMWVICICLSGYSLVYAADDTIPQDVQDWQVVASEHWKSGDLAGAQAEYKKIIQAYPHTSYGLNACAKAAELSIKQKQYAYLQPLAVQICMNFDDQSNIFRTLSDLVTKCMYAKAYPEALAVCDEVQNRLSSYQRVKIVLSVKHVAKIVIVTV